MFLLNNLEIALNRNIEICKVKWVYYKKNIFSSGMGICVYQIWIIMYDVTFMQVF